jgi:D-tyrosyl-tRNA(Tyr) deacylase
MRAVVQRVYSANVIVNQQVVGEIKEGLLILLGITHTDTEKDMEYLIRKILQLRIFNDPNQIMNLSVQDISGELLIVSQFTLYAETRKGNRPSYQDAARPEIANVIYDQFISKIQTQFKGKINTGIFGADMEVNLTNNGPVTIILDSKIP